MVELIQHGLESGDVARSEGLQELELLDAFRAFESSECSQQGALRVRDTERKAGGSPSAMGEADLKDDIVRWRSAGKGARPSGAGSRREMASAPPSSRSIRASSRLIQRNWEAARGSRQSCTCIAEMRRGGRLARPALALMVLRPPASSMSGDQRTRNAR